MSEEKNKCKPLSEGYYIDLEIPRCECSLSLDGEREGDVCDECISGGEPGDDECMTENELPGCKWRCKLCQFDPEVCIPYITGQRKALRNILKDLWDHIDCVLGRGNIHERRMMARGVRQGLV